MVETEADGFLVLALVVPFAAAAFPFPLPALEVELEAFPEVVLPPRFPGVVVEVPVTHTVLSSLTFLSTVSSKTLLLL